MNSQAAAATTAANTSSALVSTPSGIALPAPGEMLPRIAEEKDSPTSTSETTPGFMQTINEHEGEINYNQQLKVDKDKALENKAKQQQQQQHDMQLDKDAEDGGDCAKELKSVNVMTKSKCNESSEY